MVKNRMRLSAIVDLYYLESVAIVTPPFGRRAKEKLQADAIYLRDELVQTLATALYEYLWLIAWGEARHGRLHVLRGLWYYDQIPEEGRARAYKEAVAYNPHKNLPLLLELFNQSWIDGSYGGHRWSDLVAATMLYDEYPSMIYVDHVIDICHNNGLAFDKDDTRQVIPLDLDIDEPRLKNFLDFKRDYDLLDTLPPIDTSNYISIDTYNILKRYHTLYNQVIPRWLRSPRGKGNSRRLWPRYMSTVWGSGILTNRVIRPYKKGTYPKVKYAYHGYKIKIGVYLKSAAHGPDPKRT